MKRLSGNSINPLGSGDLVQDAWGVQKVSLPHSVFHGLFAFDIPPSMWFIHENGTQVYTSTRVTSVGGAARVTADATVTTALLESREAPRYEPNRGHLWSSALWLPNKTNDGVRDFGLFTTNSGTIENGVFFRLKSDGLLYAVRVSDSVEVAEEVIDTSGLTGFDVEKNNIYDIQFQWRGAGNYKFYIGDPATGASKLVHTFDLLGTLTNVSIRNPALPAAFRCVRTTEDVEMNVGCCDITSENGLIDRHQYESSYIENLSVNGTDIPVLSIYNPPSIGGNVNTRTLQLARVSMKCAKKAVFKIWTHRDPTRLTGATFQATGGGSYVETDSPLADASAVTATAFNTSGLKPLIALPAEATVFYQVDNPLRERIHFPLVRGDFVTVTATVSSSQADSTIEWGSAI